MEIDWDSVHTTMTDCLFATFQMAYWAERSQEVDYDNDSAAQHLADIVKARKTFGRAMGVVNAYAVSRLGREGQPSDPCAISNLGDQYSVFHLLAQASARESARPDFGIFATAHEAAFGLLLMLLMWVENEIAFASKIVGTSDKFIVGIEDLRRCSPEELRDTLFEIEKIKPMRRVLDSTLKQSQLRAWIDREWAAVSAILPTTLAKPKTPQGNENQYLGITVGDRVASRIVNGKTLTVRFERRIKPWDMFSELYDAGQHGLARADISKKLYPDDPVTDNALDQHKATVNQILEAILVEIKPDNRGVWRLAELNS